MANNVLSDVWGGITRAVSQKTDAAVTRLQNKTGVTAESGNTGAYLGMSIVDAVSSLLHGKADELTQKALDSKTGKKIVSDVTQQKIAELLRDWRTWAILIGFAILFLFIGKSIGGKR